MNTKLYIVILLSLINLTSCKSDFRPEIIDPRLPDYSERGLNLAGGYVDGFPWNAERDEAFFFPSSGEGDFYIYTNTDSTNNMIAIEMGVQTLDDHERQLTIGFYVEDLQLSKPHDWIKHNGKTIILDGETNYGQLYFYPSVLTIPAGQIPYIKG